MRPYSFKKERFQSSHQLSSVIQKQREPHTGVHSVISANKLLNECEKNWVCWKLWLAILKHKVTVFYWDECADQTRNWWCSTNPWWSVNISIPWTGDKQTYSFGWKRSFFKCHNWLADVSWCFLLLHFRYSIGHDAVPLKMTLVTMNIKDNLKNKVLLQWRSGRPTLLEKRIFSLQLPKS